VQVATTLLAHPGCGIIVPLMAGIGQAAERRLDVGPSAFILETTSDQFDNEGASPSRASSSVQFGKQSVIYGQVNPHGLNIAHSLAHINEPSAFVI